MKLLFFHRWVGVRLGGTETHVKELATRLARKGHTVHILTLKGMELKEPARCMTIWQVSKSYGEHLTSYGMRDPRLYAYTLMFMFKAFLKLIILKLKKVEFDVVSVHFVTEGLLMMLARRLFGWPYVFILEGYTDLEARVARYANLQIAISQAIVNKCQTKFRYKPFLIPPGVGMSRFGPSDHRTLANHYGNKTIVLTVGRLVPEKNLGVLIEAAKIVCQNDKDFSFLIVGEGREREKLERLRDALGLREHVVFLGRVDDDALPRFYRSADVFVLTQIAEDQFWIVALEAMASGLPVIAPSQTGALEILGDGGIVISPKKPEILAEKILEVAHNHSLREEISAKALRKVERYNWDRLVALYERCFRLIAKSGAK